MDIVDAQRLITQESNEIYTRISEHLKGRDCLGEFVIHRMIILELI
jgi:hypothetical protein